MTCPSLSPPPTLPKCPPTPTPTCTPQSTAPTRSISYIKKQNRSSASKSILSFSASFSVCLSMASSSLHIFLLLLLFSSSHAQTFLLPRALLLPVTKDTASRQYLTHIHHTSPPLPVMLVLDLGGSSLWMDCDRGYLSLSSRPALCRSSQCSLANASSCGDCLSGPRPGCNTNTCALPLVNAVTDAATTGELAQDSFLIQGSEPSPSFPALFTCGPTFLLQGLAKGVKGMAGMGRSRISLPSQLAREFGLRRRFAMCLSSSATSNGFLLFGDGRGDVLKSLMYTPLIAGAYSGEYFVGVKSIKINKRRLPLDASLLSIDKNGTKLSSIVPYTTLESSIYKNLVSSFLTEAEAMGMKRVSSLAPFGACFSSESVGRTRRGVAVPEIDLVLQSESVVWRIYGGNSMVLAREEVLCLAFVDGGWNPRSSIVIGGHQMEENLIEFDVAASRLGFSSSLLSKGTSCADLDFRAESQGRKTVVTSAKNQQRRSLFSAFLFSLY